jgi:hypothetical protein
MTIQLTLYPSPLDLVSGEYVSTYNNTFSNKVIFVQPRFYNHAYAVHLNLTVVPFYKRGNYRNLSKGPVTYGSNAPTQNSIQRICAISTAYIILFLLIQYVFSVKSSWC